MSNMSPLNAGMPEREEIARMLAFFLQAPLRWNLMSETCFFGIVASAVIAVPVMGAAGETLHASHQGKYEEIRMASDHCCGHAFGWR